MNRFSTAKDFFVHLRLHYQFLILSGAYLCGGLCAPALAPAAFLAQFLNVHVLLFGGVTAYNSYWDKDKGAVGGLRRPPPIAEWFLPASWILQAAGLAWSSRVSAASAAVYAFAMLFFWAYSRPGIRWKGHPWLGLPAIGVATGVCGFLLGVMHGGGAVPRQAWPAALGVAFLIVSLFPMSQVYQVEEDRERADMTFTARFGLPGMRRAFAALFPLGIALTAWSMGAINLRLGLAFLAVGAAAGIGLWQIVRRLRLDAGEYDRVMAVKYAGSAAFSAFLLTSLWLQANGVIGHLTPKGPLGPLR